MQRKGEIYQHDNLANVDNNTQKIICNERNGKNSIHSLRVKKYDILHMQTTTTN